MTADNTNFYQQRTGKLITSYVNTFRTGDADLRF